ncbi:MAG: bifunctional demethylmenaquinone methyltransferase/2-methoxy-6-polyprenyl-1,4-benzoquinol methylase UbiE [Verrucomicrobia bacterium]|nr:MAG: bifunctional demethylmenaquinone methyltransferase/2-methoxy-6-polyprenyl-1,4-benzoquinol methylase UbiE [Verrucomicrobiota bacterium]PYL62444.1 MAG: bifunctional demethylmenaquinone methyltransferase/2-methoxy-6-polyprenyl-1,4-benzoquinol methylase UbiE [Verrucomicrobiota bacterium]
MTTQPARVRKMFGSIARRYDLANHLLSCGIDFSWRRRAAEIVAEWRPQTIADLATGTGDLALALRKKLPDAEVMGVDVLPEMLDLAQRKGMRRVVLADAMNLPFNDASFDCVTIAFGLRNLENWAAALAEMLRVLKPNGHLLVLEFSLPTSPILAAIYRFYLHRCLPLLGSFLTRTKSAYDYLGDSIEEFPGGTAMCELMQANGFMRPRFHPLTGGIVTIYTAEKS